MFIPPRLSLSSSAHCNPKAHKMEPCKFIHKKKGKEQKNASKNDQGSYDDHCLTIPFWSEKFGTDISVRKLRFNGEISHRPSTSPTSRHHPFSPIITSSLHRWHRRCPAPSSLAAEEQATVGCPEPLLPLLNLHHHRHLHSGGLPRAGAASLAPASS